MKYFAKITCLLLFFLFIGCQTSSKESYNLIIENVNIIDYVSGEIKYNKDVAIRGDIIVRVDDYSKTGGKGTKIVIDGTNKYLIPGLWDNHVHSRGGDTLIKANKEFLNLFIANGITGIRDAGGDLGIQVLRWKKEITDGSLIGPALFTSGPKIDGPKPTWAGSIEVSNTSKVKNALDSLRALNVDFVKIYDSSISREVYLEVLKQAKDRTMITSGHMPFSVLLEENIKNGIGSIEHLYYILKGCSSEEHEITRQIQTNEIGFWDSFDALIKSYQEESALRSFSLLKENNVYVTPTLHIGNVLSNLKNIDHREDKFLNYIDSNLILTYQGRIDRAIKATQEQYQMRKDLQEIFKTLTKNLQNAGVSMLAGSDCGAFNSYIYPGLSLHEELVAMVDAGLTPLQALRTSTFNGAAFLNKSSFYGNIEEQKAADLLLLSQNPLVDIRNTREIDMLIYKGEVYDRNQLKQFIKATKN